MYKLYAETKELPVLLFSVAHQMKNGADATQSTMADARDGVRHSHHDARHSLSRRTYQIHRAQVQ